MQNSKTKEQQIIELENKIQSYEEARKKLFAQAYAEVQTILKDQQTKKLEAEFESWYEKRVTSRGFDC